MATTAAIANNSKHFYADFIRISFSFKFYLPWNNGVVWCGMVRMTLLPFFGFFQFIVKLWFNLISPHTDWHSLTHSFTFHWLNLELKTNKNYFIHSFTFTAFSSGVLYVCRLLSSPSSSLIIYFLFRMHLQTYTLTPPPLLPLPPPKDLETTCAEFELWVI